MAKVIMHIDMNAFFVRCEEIRDPSLEGKPGLIGHQGRSGIVSTASYAARKYGCHSGQPMFQALQQCPDALVIAPDFAYYQVMSNSFRAYLHRFTPILEQASIDECYCDVSAPLAKYQGRPSDFFHEIQDGLFQETKLRCSIGVAPTKWLAKMGSDLRKPMGITVIRKRDIKAILYPLPIDAFWGIGKKTTPKLKAQGISTIGDLASFLKRSPEEAQEEFGKFYFEIVSYLEGTSSDVVETENPDPKSIGNQETLMENFSDEADIAPVLFRLSQEVSARAKKAGFLGRSVTLQVKDTEFRLHSHSKDIRDGTNDAQEIYAKCIEMYRTYFEGDPIRLLGVTLGRLFDPKKETVQMSLWNYPQYEEMDRTKLLINDWNRSLEKPSLMRASDLKRKKKEE